MPASRFTDLIFDLGGVLLFYSTKADMAIPPRKIKMILDSLDWHRYERGQLSQRECYESIARQYGVDPVVLETAVDQLASSLTPNQDLISAIKDLKTMYPDLRVHALSNAPEADFERIRANIQQWGIFDNIFISSVIGYRIPEFSSYHVALHSAKADGHTSIFVDDRIENVLTAQSLGLKGIHFIDTLMTVTALHNLLGSPIDRAMKFLRQNPQELFCKTNEGDMIRDNFSQLLIYRCTKEKDLVTFRNEGYTWQFYFQESNAGNDVSSEDQTLPRDLDTTALALTTLDVPDTQKQAVIDLMLRHLSVDRLPLTYFEASRPRLCPFVAANVLRFLYFNGQGAKLPETRHYLCRLLESRAYELGSRYYCQPDWIIYYLAELCGKCADDDLAELKRIVTTQLIRRMGADKDIIGAALRLSASHFLGLGNSEDMRTLLMAQQLDGGWEFTWIYQNGSSAVRIGSRGVPTALAVMAIRSSTKETMSAV